MLLRLEILRLLGATPLSSLEKTHLKRNTYVFGFILGGGGGWWVHQKEEECGHEGSLQRNGHPSPLLSRNFLATAMKLLG